MATSTLLSKLGKLKTFQATLQDLCCGNECLAEMLVNELVYLLHRYPEEAFGTDRALDGTVTSWLDSGKASLFEQRSDMSRYIDDREMWVTEVHLMTAVY